MCVTHTCIYTEREKNNTRLKEILNISTAFTEQRPDASLPASSSALCFEVTIVF